MCWGCNPLCGGCTPPRQKAVECPACGWMNILNVQSKGAPKPVGCERCELDLTDFAVTRAIVCERFSITCASPCGLARKPIERGNPGKCQNRTEPDEWHQIHIPNVDEQAEQS